jgi:hypothetical protein
VRGRVRGGKGEGKGTKNDRKIREGEERKKREGEKRAQTDKSTILYVRYH